MPQTKLSIKCVLLQFGLFWKFCGAQVNTEDTNHPPDGRGGEGGAFYALRSCHQQLHGDSGEFFSPDYMCSNPPLWCNWSIQVHPGKRIHLHLEDLTPDDTCHIKQDQIHVDEPEGHQGGHNILQKCWREAKYTSSSNTLHVVLLIAGSPSPPYRGFYGRYQAFGPPVAFNPQEDVRERHWRAEPSVDLKNWGEISPVKFNDPNKSSLANSDLYEYYDEPADSGAEADENQSLASVEPRASASSPNSLLVSQQQQQNEGLEHHPKPSTHSPTTMQRNMDEASEHPDKVSAEGATFSEVKTQSWTEEEKSAVDGENKVEVHKVSHQNPSQSERPEPEQYSNMVERLSDHRVNINKRNHSEVPHLPGGHLFEVAVEVNFSLHLGESWDDVVRSLLLWVKTLISEQLKDVLSPQTMSPKRIKRLNAGVLFILWLQIGQGPGGPQVHKAVHSIVQNLIDHKGNHGNAIIMSVSTADVNECGTQLVLCDINADCENSFGSYSCRCRQGFKDESRLGSGGTVCVEVKAEGCNSGLSAGPEVDQNRLSPESKGVYVLFFLLSSLFLMLLVVAAVFYRRHHRGAFMVHTSSTISPPDPNNNDPRDETYSGPTDPDFPPPPPPMRAPRDGWSRPAVDVPLLRFSSLLPPEGCKGPPEGPKK